MGCNFLIEKFLKSRLMDRTHALFQACDALRIALGNHDPMATAGEQKGGRETHVSRPYDADLFSNHSICYGKEASGQRVIGHVAAVGEEPVRAELEGVRAIAGILIGRWTSDSG